MFTRKRKSDDLFENTYETKISLLIEEIKNVLNTKNIFINEEIIQEEKDIIIRLTDNNNNLIGKINGGVEEFPIIENGEETYKDAFSILWLKVENNYQGLSLGTFLIIYCIYLCKKNFSDVEYIFLDDDTDEIDPSKNIYLKLGFVYQKEKETMVNEDGQMISVNNGSEMQLKISDFFNDELLDKLNKINIKWRNWNKNGGSRRKNIKRKSTRKYRRKTMKRKSMRKINL